MTTVGIILKPTSYGSRIPCREMRIYTLLRDSTQADLVEKRPLA